MRNSVCTAVLLVVATIIFAPVWFGGTLLTTDDNIGAIAGYKSHLEAGFGVESWSESPLVGLPAGSSPLNWSNLLIKFMPVRLFANTFHALSLLAGSIALFFYLRRKDLAPAAALLAALTAFWLGSNFTLIYAGHIRKFSIVFLFCATLICLDKLFETKRWNWSVIAGALIGIMFLEQQDVALFFGLFAGAYALFLVAQSPGERTASFLRLLPIVVIALLTCIGPVISSYQQNVAGIASMEQSRAEKWDFCTQWSQPPEDSIDFIAPGYTGWRSGEPSGPYWGRMGRSAGWEETRQGFMNFRLENTYLGVIPVLLAIFALFSARASAHRAVIFFWGGAALVALLLAFGKYTPLYALFWQLPVINNIRNPNKFIQIFQVAVAILAAFGLDTLLKNKASSKKFFWVTIGVFGFLALWAFGTAAGQAGIAADFSKQGWPSEMARVMAGRQSAALWHAAIMALFAAAAFSIFSLPRFEKLLRHGNRIAAALIALVAIDGILLAGHYVQTLPGGYIEENDVTRLLTEKRGDQRTAMVSQDSFYNIWLTYLFPYHDLPHFNITQMPRMPQDYQQFLSALNRNPLRMWQLAGVGYLLGPAEMAAQLPAGQYDQALRYDVAGSANGSLTVQPNPQGQHAVFAAKVPAPRFALVGRAEIMPDEQALATLASPAWTPFQTLLLPPDSTGELLDQVADGSIDVLEQRDGFALLRVQTAQPAYLRIAERFDAGWTARVNDRETDVLRADFLFQAVQLESGEHVVELAYAPSGNRAWMTQAGLGLSLLAALALFVPRRKS